LHAIIDGRLERLLDHPLLEVMAVKRRIEDPLGFDWSKRNVQELSPTVGYVDTVLGNTNLIVHQLLEQKETTYPILVTLFRKANNAVVVSFRSRNGEALKVAENSKVAVTPTPAARRCPVTSSRFPRRLITCVSR